jgi:hypothetical protein
MADDDRTTRTRECYRAQHIICDGNLYTGTLTDPPKQCGCYCHTLRERS